MEVRPMYGTIARLHPRTGRVDELMALGESLRSASMDGFRASYLFRPDHNPYFRETVFLVAVFDDSESYRANANSPEQDARYQELRALLEDDPDWMDGTFLGG
jgi:heme-degrading monooxygenase HmoA